MEGNLFLFVISALPIFLIGYYVYNKDRNKESGNVLASLFFAGIGSCFLVIVCSLLLGLFIPFFNSDVEGLNFWELIIYVFIGIALIEEFCKWVMVYKIAYNNESFDEFYDMIVYSVFVALGFAFLENLLYVYPGGFITGVTRGLLAIPGHACCGVLMGYYLGLAKINGLNNRDSFRKRYMIYSALVPVLVHGIYDYCLFIDNDLFLFIFYIFIIGLDIYIVRKVKVVSSISKKIRYKNNYCSNCGRVVNSNYCPICGRKNE